MYIARLNSINQAELGLFKGFVYLVNPRDGLQNKTYSPPEADCLKLWFTLSQLASDLEKED